MGIPINALISMWILTKYMVHYCRMPFYTGISQADAICNTPNLWADKIVDLRDRAIARRGE